MHGWDPEGRSGSTDAVSVQSLINRAPDVGTKFAKEGRLSGNEERRGKGARIRTFLLILVLLMLLANLVAW